MDGILNINKATGMTSHDVVARVRKLLQQKRVGHAGTLDPAASGVLPVCIGQATRVAEYLSEGGKTYQAEIIFGVVTDTYDSEGTVVRTGDVNELTLPRIEEALQDFLGPQMQVPPRYSAIKLQGRPAYKLARAGEEIALEPRPVTLSRLEVTAWRPPRLDLTIECSKGTYIRSLAYDLGERLGCGAHLGSLVRTRSGPFQLSDSITLEQLAQAVSEGQTEQGPALRSFLYPPDVALQHYPALVLDDATLERVLHGNAFTWAGAVEGRCSEHVLACASRHVGAGRGEGGGEWSGGPVERGGGDPCDRPEPLARVYDGAGHFVATAQWDHERGRWQPKKVLAT